MSVLQVSAELETYSYTSRQIKYSCVELTMKILIFLASLAAILAASYGDYSECREDCITSMVLWHDRSYICGSDGKWYDPDEFSCESNCQPGRFSQIFRWLRWARCEVLLVLTSAFHCRFQGRKGLPTQTAVTTTWFPNTVNTGLNTTQTQSSFWTHLIHVSLIVCAHWKLC